MTDTTQKQVAEASAFPRKTLMCESGPGIDDQGRNYAKLLTSPEMSAVRVVAMMQPKRLADDLDFPTLQDILKEQASAAQKGDLSHAEAMLMNQAISLEAMFVRLAERGMDQSNMSNLDTFLRLALRAQSQCRTTLETLAAIKHPPIVYARQANVTTGPQQVNNGTAVPAHAREIHNAPTQLSGGTNELLQDTRASGIASGFDSPMEAMGTVNRAKVRRR